MIGSVTPEALPNDIGTLQTALAAERAARQQAEARASGAEAMVAYLKRNHPVTAVLQTSFGSGW